MVPEERLGKGREACKVRLSGVGENAGCVTVRFGCDVEHDVTKVLGNADADVFAKHKRGTRIRWG